MAGSGWSEDGNGGQWTGDSDNGGQWTGDSDNGVQLAGQAMAAPIARWVACEMAMDG